MGKVAVLGSTTSFLHRFASYVYLRWIPGRFAPIGIPVVFALSLIAQILNWQYTTTVDDISPAEQALVPATPDAPSYAQVTAVDPPAHPTGAQLDDDGVLRHSTNTTVRRKKKKNNANATSLDDSSPAATTRRKLEQAHRPPKSDTSLTQTLSSLIIGTPSPSRFLNVVAVLTNLALLACVVDSVWSPILAMNESGLSFVRVGAVDHHSAKIVARIPPTTSFSASAPVNSLNGSTASFDEDLVPAEDFAGAKLVYRPTKPLGKWISGTEIRVNETRDFTGTVKVDGLWASTEYEFRLLRASLVAAHHPAFPKSYFFTTAPDPALSSAAVPGAGTHYTFASSSCLKPGFPYNGPASKRTTKGAEYLKVAAENLGLRFVLFLGDFIYGDVPYFPGPERSSFQKRYRQTFASPEVHELAETVPIMAIYDDHDLGQNDIDTGENNPVFAPAKEAYLDYFGDANPEPVEPGVSYYEYRYGDSAFFVLDTRAYRSPNHSEDDEDKTMLGEKQKQALFDWAARVNNTVTWKFVVSSVPFMSLWSYGDDTWAGFITERDTVLDVLQYVPNVIILSGDRHEAAAASLRTTVTEFSTSPLSMFYLPIRTVSQSHGRGATGEDVLLQYLPDGNSKFSTFEVDTRIANEPVVRVKVWIDGAESPAWSVEVRGKPIDVPRPPSAIGSLGKSLLELLGFKKRSWF